LRAELQASSETLVHRQPTLLPALQSSTRDLPTLLARLGGGTF
jgi:hypothetical protein